MLATLQHFMEESSPWTVLFCMCQLSLRLQTAGWMVQGSKEREGANLSDDLALQLHLQLGIVTAGVGEIPSGRMSCKWSNRRYIGLSWPGWWTRGDINLGLA